MILYYLNWLGTPFSGLLGAGLALAVSCHALLRRRDPRAVLIWILVAWLLPFLGPVLYYFFGINRIRRRASQLRRFAAPSASPAIVLSRHTDEKGMSPRLRHLQTLSRLVDSVVEMPLTEGNRVRPLINGDQAFPSMIDAINRARTSVGLATYIFNGDRVGAMFLKALKNAAERNVQVRVLIDAVGAGFQRTSIYKELSKNRIPVAVFLPTFTPWTTSYMNMRNHRKILTVDGVTGFTGGINIHENHALSLNPSAPCQDVHFQIEGPVVAQLQETFREDWFFSAGEVLDQETWFPKIERIGSVKARGIPDGPDEDFEKCRWTILGALANARESIRVVTPYFVPDATLVTALNLEAIRGLKVGIVLPEMSDLLLVKWASEAMLWEILERGCRVWSVAPPFEHSKMMLVDGAWALFGSTNWDRRSLRLNFEFDVECYDEALVSSLEKFVQEKISRARPVTLADVRGRKLPTKLRDGVARLFAPIL